MPLFDRTADFCDDLYRNIVSLRVSEDLFDDLSEGDPGLSSVAAEAEMRVKKHIPAGLTERGFHYTCAIGYPFETQPFMATRYGDGTFGVWYGSLELNTSIYETAWHTKNDILNVHGIDEPVVRERAVYLVRCDAILIDLRGKQRKYPELVGNAYGFCQNLGTRLKREGHPGLLAPSARCDGGNSVIFEPKVLGNPRLNCFFTYTFDPESMQITVERGPGERILQI